MAGRCMVLTQNSIQLLEQNKYYWQINKGHEM